MIGESLNQIVASVPIMSIFFFTGGLFYTMCRCVKNEATSPYQKLKEIGVGSALFGHATLSTLLGVTLGQVLLPVPFLGGFAGGILGGYWGSLGSQRFASFMLSRRFRRVVAFLKKNVREGRYWDFSAGALQELGLDYGYFERSNPRGKAKDHIWLTAVCLCIASCY